ncbi:MAG: hypothetical protein HY293_02230 [Planctomycetes bacterium]|nr:hypothetical protein [Planctomycetota bacterium]
MRRRVAGILIGLLAACSATEPSPPPRSGIRFRDHARAVSGRDVLEPTDLVAALREVARRRRDSPELLLRDAYFLLNLWPDGVDWEVVRPLLAREGVVDTHQWVAGNPEQRWYRFQFTAQPAAWVSPGGHVYDLVVEADLKFDVAPGRRSRGVVKDPEATLRAAINRDRLEAAKAGGYAPGSPFRKAMEAGAHDSRVDLPFLTEIQAQYQGLFDRWSDLSPFGFDVRAEFVDHPVARFNSATQFFYVVAELDPPIGKDDKLMPGEKAEFWLSSEKGIQPGGGLSSSLGEDGHGFVRVESSSRVKDDC